MTSGGTLPARKPGMFTWLAISLYALSTLGLSSANGTSMVILARDGLSFSTVLGKVVSPLGGILADSRLRHVAPR